MSDAYETEYGIAYEIDAESWYIPTGKDLADAHQKLARQIRHHGRNGVTATDYRVVARRIKVEPWAEPSR